MNKILLETLIKLFALISAVHPSLYIENIKLFIQSFLRKEFSPDILNEYLIIFNDYRKEYFDHKEQYASKKEISEFIHKLTSDLVKELNIEDRFLLLIRLLFFHKFLFKYETVKNTSGFVGLDNITKDIATALNINDKDYDNCKAFIFEKLYNISNTNDLLIIAGRPLKSGNIHFIERENLHGQIYFLKIASANILLFYYKGPDNITIDNYAVFPENIYIFDLGAKIDNDHIEPVYYNQVAKKFQAVGAPEIELKAQNLEFTFPRSNNGIHQLSLIAKSGEMIGVIGKSGVGKSTLINLLTGLIKPGHGKVLINNYELLKNRKKLEGLIGYIPQDDLLVEELTVFENLYLSSKLCLGNLSNKEITERVNELLISLNLYEAKDLKVGTPLNKFISGGQRKRLNIALELIREPWILFADEPTSGLAITDAHEIMELLVNQTAKGKIVLTNIHQPSSEHFKMFDKILVLDNEGFPVYFGNPVDSISYFNQTAHKFVKLSDRCQLCGNVNHETIFNILTEKKVDNKGFPVNERKISVKQWHNNYIEHLPEEVNKENSKEDALPKTEFKKPPVLNQFLIFLKRDWLSKISNHQYVAISLLITPVLATILALLTRSGIDKATMKYVFIHNENIPAYLFMSVIVSLFVGLIISAEEIYRDRKMLKREQFLNLNKPAYLFSKLSFLFFISLIQTILYVVIGNAILEIKGMVFQYALILFTTACFANTLGLLISTLFNSVVVIYILVPLLVVPQILLSGTIVQYDKLNEKVVSEKFVPVIGDFMVSRWAYEALVVTQFKDNKFQKNYFKTDQKVSNLKYDLLFLIPEVESALDEIKFDDANNPEQKINFIRSLINTLKQRYTLNISDQDIDQLPDTKARTKMELELRNIKQELNTDINRYMIFKDSVTNKLVENLGGIDEYNQFKNMYYNNSLADMVLNRNTFEPAVKSLEGNELIRKIEPIYQKPMSNYGRAHFLSATKRIKNLEFYTLTFNISIIWLISIITFIILVIIFKQKNLIIK
ncbi:MAG: ATP-binding cassette domain-containing protein [Bacteroidales bacterium]